MRVMAIEREITRDEMEKLRGTGEYATLRSRMFRKVGEQAYTVYTYESVALMRAVEKLVEEFESNLNEIGLTINNLDGSSVHISEWGDLRVDIMKRRP